MGRSDRQRCAGCVYWKKLSSGSGGGCCACHFLLDANRTRRRDADGTCLEYRRGKRGQADGQ